MNVDLHVRVLLDVDAVHEHVHEQDNEPVDEAERLAPRVGSGVF